MQRDGGKNDENDPKYDFEPQGKGDDMNFVITTGKISQREKSVGRVIFRNFKFILDLLGWPHSGPD